jgi:hypothetical protein
MINNIEDISKKEAIKIIKIQQEEYALLLSENKVQADRIAELEAEAEEVTRNKMISEHAYGNHVIALEAGLKQEKEANVQLFAKKFCLLSEPDVLTGYYRMYKVSGEWQEWTSVESSASLWPI